MFSAASRNREGFRLQFLLSAASLNRRLIPTFQPSFSYSGSVSLSIAPKSDSTLELLPLALKGLAQIHRAGFQIRKTGVLLDDLELADKAPRRLWDTVQHELHRQLMAAVDAINDRLGKDSIHCGLFPSRGIWQTRFERRSPAYTTNWRELMVAR